MTMSLKDGGLTRVVLGVLFIGLLLFSSLWILRPFFSSLIWATTIVIATWPLMTGIQARLFGKRWAATLVMTLTLLLVLIIPFVAAVANIISHSSDIVKVTSALSSMVLPPPPEWLGKLPLIGAPLTEQWQQLAALPQEELAEKLAPYAKKAMDWFVVQAGDVGIMVVQFLLTVIISAILYTTGESAANGMLQFGRRLAGQQGHDVMILAAKSIRGVALGIVVTALIQSALGGIGLAVCGVPAAMILTVIMFILCIAQVGVGPVLFGGVAWLFWKDQTLWASVLLVWSLVVVSLDNFLRPVLIKKGADLPLLLIFAGVLGGLIAFGIIGLFIGPVVLAVTYTLLEAWVTRGAPAQSNAVDTDA